MQDKLQELTDRLYNEGLSKGKAEGESLIAKAKEEAAEIIRKAQEEADSIIKMAKKEAEDVKEKTRNDIVMASEQTLQATKNDIESLIVSKVVDEKVSKDLGSIDFLKEIITTVAQKFDTTEQKDLSLILPESLKSALEPFVNNELGKLLKNGISAVFSKKVNGGFNIGPKDGSYFISLTDDTFKSLISNYLRPATKKILFGENTTNE